MVYVRTLLLKRGQTLSNKLQVWANTLLYYYKLYMTNLYEILAILIYRLQMTTKLSNLIPRPISSSVVIVLVVVLQAP